MQMIEKHNLTSHISVEWVDTCQAWIARHPDYPMSGSGDTQEEAIQILLELIEDYQEDLAIGKVRKRGRPVKQNARLDCNLLPETRAFIDSFCLAESLNQGRVIDEIVKYYRENHPHLYLQ